MYMAPPGGTAIIGVEEELPVAPSRPDVSSSAAEGRCMVSFPAVAAGVGRLEMGCAGRGPLGKGISGCAKGAPMADGIAPDPSGCCGSGPNKGSADAPEAGACTQGLV